MRTVSNCNNGEEVFKVACCAKQDLFIYIKLIDGQVRSMGTNLFDHLKHCATLSESLDTNSEGGRGQ